MNTPRPRVLLLTEGGPSHTLGRAPGQFTREHFSSRGFDVIFRNRRPAFLYRLALRPPRFLAPLTAIGPGRVLLYALMEVIARLREPFLIATAETCDVVYMCKIRTYRLVDKLRKKTRAKLILDFGDAMWLYERAPRFMDILAMVDEVTTDNEYTAGFVRAVNEHCTVVFDPPQIELFDTQRARHRRKAQDHRVVLGWIGSPTTVYNLYLIWPVLERLFVKYPNIELRLVGIGEDACVLPPFEHIRHSIRSVYDQSAMIEEVLGFDIGLFPQFDTEKGVVRGVLKASVYMAGEAAVIASPVGQSTDFIHDGVDGMLATTEKEWEEKLSRLIEDASLRRRLTGRALETMRTSYTVDAAFTIVAGVLNRLLGWPS